MVYSCFFITLGNVIQVDEIKFFQLAVNKNVVENRASKGTIAPRNARLFINAMLLSWYHRKVEKLELQFITASMCT